jgi:hypothetical protein
MAWLCPGFVSVLPRQDKLTKNVFCFFFGLFVSVVGLVVCVFV